MTITELNTAIGARLTALQISGSAAFHEVIAAPQDEWNDFGGFPSCTYFYETTESDYATVSENRRVVTFSVFIYAVSQNKTLAETYTWIYGLIDAVVNDFDRADDLGLPVNWLRPVPADMTRETTERGEGLIANVRLMCEFDQPVV